MSQTLKSTEDYPILAIIILFALFGKDFYDFKVMGGFNYLFLIKTPYMILIIFTLIILFQNIYY